MSNLVGVLVMFWAACFVIAVLAALNAGDFSTGVPTVC